MGTTLLDTNPSGLLPEEDRSGNEAWSTYTSDHAQIWGHRIDDDGWVADQRGGMVTVLAGGYNALQPDDFRFAPPREMHEPRLVRSWDEEYAAAIHGLLGRRGELSRRLARAIDWLELAWQNGDSLDENLRIAALYSGFEVLLARPADAKAAALALSALLDRPGTRKRQYTSWRTKRGNPVPDKISQLAWWFVQFAWLRNAILHGDRLTSRHYHDRRGRSHKWMAELKLREAIKETVASAGYSDLRLTPRERALRRAYSKLIAAAK